MLWTCDTVHSSLHKAIDSISSATDKRRVLNLQVICPFLVFGLLPLEHYLLRIHCVPSQQRVLNAVVGLGAPLQIEAGVWGRAGVKEAPEVRKAREATQCLPQKHEALSGFPSIHISTPAQGGWGGGWSRNQRVPRVAIN